MTDTTSSDNELRTDRDLATLPSEEAFDPAQLRFTTADGEQVDLEVVGNDGIEEDAYVDGRYGGRRQSITLEGEYDGPCGEGYYVFRSTLAQKKRNDHVEVQLWISEVCTDSGEEEEITIIDVEVLE